MNGTATTTKATAIPSSRSAPPMRGELPDDASLDLEQGRDRMWFVGGHEERTSEGADSEDDASDEDSAFAENQVVARSTIGTAFYLFHHQAGGHKPFLRSATGEVCKPAIQLELQFYQSLDTHFPQLKRFVPRFMGVITVDLHPSSPADSNGDATTALGYGLSEVSIDDDASAFDSQIARTTKSATFSW
ncbi:hypothetical protein PINS_up010547 [Pythium insidiosum]|nr:hypothetical protein PINS_up010547 [Pythium insidiosum]